MTYSKTRQIQQPETVIEEEDCSTQDENIFPSRDNLAMSRQSSVPVDNVINSFHLELDNLSKSIEDMLSPSAHAAGAGNMYNSYNDKGNGTPYSRSTRGFSTAKKEPLRVKDPPPSAERFSPLRKHGNSTPARRQQNYSSSSGFFSPAEPPPAPVDTPALYGTPNATPSRRSGRNESSSRRFNTDRMSPVLEPQDLRFDSSQPNTEGSGWQEALNKMRTTLQEQEKRIKELEKENEALKEQVSEFRADGGLGNNRNNSNGHYNDNNNENYYRSADPLSARNDSRSNASNAGHFASRQRSKPPKTFREDFSAYGDDWGTRTPRRNADVETNNKSYHREEPCGRRPASTTSTYRTTPLSTPARTIRSPPRRIHTTANPDMVISEEAFTPGTKFVADLARLMKMEKGHHAPLSVILDKHWDQLAHHFHEQNY